MNFSVNQNRHFYLAESYNDSSASGGKSIDDASVAAGAIEVKSFGEGNEKEIFFLSKNKATGEVIKSDRINLQNISCIKAYKASDMVTPLKKVEVTLDKSVNGGAPVAGQDYVLAIDFHQWVGSGEVNQYYKDGAVHATSSMTASDFYKAMVKSLNASFSREVGATKDSNPYLDFAVDNTTTATKIVITEKPQSWSLGTESQERVLFDVRPTTIYTGYEDVIWGKAEDKTPAKASAVVGTNAIGNGKKIADLEYFCMGERGDQYRNMGWPNVITTKYAVDATKEYNVLEVHFAFRDEGVNSYRSEKDITIAVPVGASGSEYDVIDDIIGGINTAAGSTLVAELE
jgi:hypothetical protein